MDPEIRFDEGGLPLQSGFRFDSGHSESIVSSAPPSVARP
jgi:hypothetical protein